MEKIIGCQTIAIKTLKNSRVNLGEAVKLMRAEGMSLKSACEALDISLSGSVYKRIRLAKSW